MVDGVKILCIGTALERWECNSLLVFSSKVDVTTGEILKVSKVAFYRGLSFHIVPSTIGKQPHLFIRGSLAMYYNNGENNAFDFTIEMLADVINELHLLFGINPNTAVLQSLEYGCNIEAPKPIRSILQGLRAYKGYEYALLKIDDKINGKQLKRSETAVKIYDKSKQVEGLDSEVLRIELVLKYSRQMLAYGINRLNDLLNVELFNKLKESLLSVWNESIYYDAGMKWRAMTNKEREKILFYLDATNWAKFTRMQRKRAKARFIELNNTFGTSTTQTEIANLISEKLDKLTAKKCYVFQDLPSPTDEQIEANKMLRFPCLDKGRERNKNSNQKPIKNGAMKNTKFDKKTAGKKCVVCGCDISIKKARAVYCSKRCNNSRQALKRKEKRHTVNKIETDVLNAITSTLKRWAVFLSVTYKDKGQLYTDVLQSNEIATRWAWIRKVVKVSGTNEDKTAVLTGNRAKELIKRLNKLNNQK